MVTASILQTVFILWGIESQHFSAGLLTTSLGTSGAFGFFFSHYSIVVSFFCHDNTCSNSIDVLLQGRYRKDTHRLPRHRPRSSNPCGNETLPGSRQGQVEATGDAERCAIFDPNVCNYLPCPLSPPSSKHLEPSDRSVERT